ncbi:transcriptional regulator [Alistipes sp. An54]|nr:transcriptional regulator [Alistipes sp. An54]
MSRRPSSPPLVIRRVQGLTQESVRFDTDLNIGRIESGRHSILLTTLADLCDYYHISQEDFFREIVTRK